MLCLKMTIYEPNNENICFVFSVFLFREHMSDIDLKKDIARSMKTLNQMYFLNQNHPYMGGDSYVVPAQDTDITIFPNTTNNLLSSPSSIPNLTYYLFGTQYSTSFFKTNAIGNNTSVHVLKTTDAEGSVAASYVSETIDRWESMIYDKIAPSTPAIGDVVDINVSSLMSDVTEIRLLNALYALYDLMSDTNWTTFQNRVDLGTHRTMRLKLAQITSGKNKTAELRSKDKNDSSTDGANLHYLLGDSWESILITFADDEKFVPFALRRLMYLYIRNFQFNIILSLIDKSTTTPTDYYTPSAKLAQSIYALLETDIITLKDDTNVRMTEGVANRIRRYNNFTRSINEINDTYGETKDYVKANSERYDSESKYEGKASAIMYSSVAILIVSLAVSFISVGLNMDMKQKLMIAGGSAAFASIAGLALFVVFTKQVVEGFAATPRTAFASSRFTSSLTKKIKEETITDYKTAILDLSREYIQYIAVLIQTITSYRSFGNVTYSMAKEYRYYVDHNTTLRNTGDKYRVAHRASDLYQKKHGATIYLCILLAIICSVMAIAYIWVGESAPFLQTYVLGLGGVIIFVIFVIYIMEITGYVRTDGDKKYWGKPPANSL